MKTIIACMIASLVVASQLFAQGSSDVPKAYNAETMLNLCRGEVSDIPPEMQSMTCTFRLQGVGDMMSFNCLSREAGFEPAPAFSAQISAHVGPSVKPLSTLWRTTQECEVLTGQRLLLSLCPRAFRVKVEWLQK